MCLDQMISELLATGLDIDENQEIKEDILKQDAMSIECSDSDHVSDDDIIQEPPFQTRGEME